MQQINRRKALAGIAGVGAAALLPGLAQSRTVATLGDRQIIVLSDGGFQLPLAMLARARHSDEMEALLRSEGLPTDVINSVLNVTLIKDGENYTIIDCGAGANFLAGSGKLAASLESANIDKEKVTRVLFTHAHPDHLWGAIDEFDSDLFPNARYAMPEAEWAFWASPDVYSKLPEDRHAFAAGAQRIFKAIGEKVTRFKPGQEVAPAILAVDTAGHTPGHVSFEVAGGGKSLMVLGDALTHAIVSFRHPGWLAGSDTDADRAAATRHALLDRLTAERTPIIGYHLPVPGLGRAEKAGLAYRFVAGA